MDQGATGPADVKGQDLMTPGEAAKVLRVHRSTLGRWAKAGLVSAVTLRSGHRRYERADVEAIRATGATGGVGCVGVDPTPPDTALVPTTA